MILNKFIIIEVTSKNLNYIKRFFKDSKIGDRVNFEIKKLSFSSPVKIDVSCDKCNKVYNMNLANYNMNLRRNDNKFVCSNCCKTKKYKQTCFKKYGVYNVSNIKSVVEKRKQTMIENWGVDNHMKNKEFVNEMKKDNLEKYGYETPFSSKEILDKCRETSKRNYGVENPFSSKEIQDRIKKTMLERYGAEHPLGSNKIRKKFEKTMLEKYGVENPSKSEELKNKSINTKLKQGLTFKSDDWNIYRREVRCFTFKNKQTLFEKWDGYDYYDGEYIKDNFQLNCNKKNYPTVDHKISIVEGYRLSIPPETIGSIDNLCYTKRTLNSKKNYKQEKDYLNDFER